MPESDTAAPTSIAERFPLLVADVARQLDCGPETVRRLVRSGALEAFRANPSPRAPLRFSQAFVDSYLARRRV